MAGDKGAKTHVLTLVDIPSVTGGAERLALEIATRLDQERFLSTLCVSRFTSEEAANESERHALSRIRESGIRFLPLRRHRRAQILPWRHLGAYLRRERVDVLHAHMFGSNLWGTIVGRLARVPVVVAHEHTWSFEGHCLRRLLDRELIARFSDAFVAVSREDRRKMIEIERIPARQIHFIPNGIAPSEHGAGHDVRAELGISPRAPLVGAVGSLRAQKAYDVLIRAAALLRERHPELRVLIAGEGPERPRLETLVTELGMDDAVLMPGRRLDVPDVLAALDVAICSSDFEGSPLSVMEYMEAARPIVATCVGGIPDLIEDGVHGLLVRPADPSALAGAVESVLRDPARASDLGERARLRRREEFDLKVLVKKLETLYEQLLASARHPSR